MACGLRHVLALCQETSWLGILRSLPEADRIEPSSLAKNLPWNAPFEVPNWRGFLIVSPDSPKATVYGHLFVCDGIRTTVYNARVFMPTVHETAYPRLKSNVSRRELIDLYTPTQAEVELATRVSKGEPARFGFLILLKTFQRLGYFIVLRDLPRSIIEYIRTGQGILTLPDHMAEYEKSE